jgi:ABC-2 type transport system ATP-binding protein
VEVAGVTKTFRAATSWRQMGRGSPRITALDDIDFQVRRGEIFGLLGPNGAGKTTMVKILAGLVLPDQGSARVEGHDVRDSHVDLRRIVGVVYGDERSFQWRISVRDNLRFFARLYGMSRSAADRRITELLHLVGLEHAEDRRLLAFSSGMRQRAAIARGLLHDPQVVLMDEPSRMLDPVGAHDLQLLVRDRVAGEGRTVLLTTNNMSEAEALCDRLMLVKDGRRILTGSIDELRAAVRPDLTYRLRVSGSEPDRTLLWSIDGVNAVDLSLAGRDVWALEVTIEREGSALPAVIRGVLDGGGNVLACTQQEIGLDQVFRDVVREDPTRVSAHA